MSRWREVVLVGIAKQDVDAFADEQLDADEQSHTSAVPCGMAASG